MSGAVVSAPYDDRLSRIVADAMDFGSLLGQAGYGKSLTLAGKRRHTIRVQSDIFRALYTPDTGPPFYPDLWPRVRAEVAAWQIRRSG